jgi:hypothetical protein
MKVSHKNTKFRTENLLLAAGNLLSSVITLDSPSREKEKEKSFSISLEIVEKRFIFYLAKKTNKSIVMNSWWYI